MADPTTELAKEFLEMNHYSVRKETKFHQNKKAQGTPSDIDIIAISPKGIPELKLGECIVGEVKNWSIMKRETFDEIYDDKFRFMESQPQYAWQQLKDFIPTKNFDKVLFCFATNQDTYDYALKKGINIVTTGQMLKNLASFFKTSERNWTYYPEMYNYNAIKGLMCYLYKCNNYKDKLTLEDLVWIDYSQEKRYRNLFADRNAKFLEEFVYHQTSGEIFSKLLERCEKEYPEWLKRKLKENQKFWKYLTA